MNRSEFLEIGEERVPRAEEVYTPEVVAEPVVLEPPQEAHGPPGALDPVPRLHPFGITMDAYLYSQLQKLSGEIQVLGGGAGDVVTTGEENTFITQQFITIENGDPDSPVLTLCQDDSNPAVTYTLELCHTYDSGAGTVGTGVGFRTRAETATEGQMAILGGLHWQWTDATLASPDSHAQLFTVANGVAVKPMDWFPDTVLVQLEPAASATKALLNLGSVGALTGGSAAGTVYGANMTGSFTGDFVNYQINGAEMFRVDDEGNIYIQGVLLSPGGGGDAFIGVSNAWSAQQPFTLDDTTSNAPSYPVLLRHTHSAGAGANGIGVGIGFELETASSTVATFGRLYVDSSNAAVGNLTSAMHFRVWDNNTERELLTVGNNYVRANRPPANATDRALIWAGDAVFLGHGVGTLFGASMDAGYGGNMLDLQVGTRPRILTTGAGQTTLTVHDSAETGPTAALTLEHRIDSVDTPAAGMGVGLEFKADDAGKTSRIYAKIEAEATDPAIAAVDSHLTLYASRGGSQENVLRFTPTGRMEIQDDIWQNAVKRRLHRSAMVVLMQGFDPAGTGADVAELVIPHDPEDGTTSITWNVKAIYFRVGTAGGAPSIKVQSSSASGAFGAGTDIGTVTLVSGDNEATKTSAFDSGTVSSGNKVRVNVLALGTATDWSVQMLLESQ